VIRRAALAALFVLLLSTTTVSAATKTISVDYPNFSPAGPKIARGTTITWHNLNSFAHTATSNVPGLWTSVNISANGTTAPLTFNQAGSFLYHCSIHTNMHGKIKVSMTASPSTGTRATQFTLTLGNAAVPAGFTHDVAYSRNGGTFVALPSTTAMTTTFKASLTGTYRFHTRLHPTNGASPAAYSPTVSVTVN
jgi:plastocyanin